MHFVRVQVDAACALPQSTTHARTPHRPTVAFVVAIYDTGVGGGGGGSRAYVELLCALSYGFRHILRHTTCCDFLSLATYAINSPTCIHTYMYTHLVLHIVYTLASAATFVTNERAEINAYSFSLLDHMSAGSVLRYPCACNISVQFSWLSSRHFCGKSIRLVLQ